MTVAGARCATRGRSGRFHAGGVTGPVSYAMITNCTRSRASSLAGSRAGYVLAGSTASAPSVTGLLLVWAIPAVLTPPSPCATLRTDPVPHRCSGRGECRWNRCVLLRTLAVPLRWQVRLLEEGSVEPELAAPAASGATTLVGLMVSESWDRAKECLVRFSARGTEGTAAAAEWEASREEPARTAGDDLSAADIEAEWRMRLRRLLQPDALAAEELRLVLEELRLHVPAERASTVHNTLSGTTVHGPSVRAHSTNPVTFRSRRRRPWPSGCGRNTDRRREPRCAQLPGTCPAAGRAAPGERTVADAKGRP